VSAQDVPVSHPDPMRAHGAWVDLFAAIGGGALVGAERGVEPALLVGTGFAGAFLVVAAVSVGVKRRLRQTLVGAGLALLAPLLALWLGAEPGFLVVMGCAAVVGAAAITLERSVGLLSRSTLIVGIAALALAAPASAVAGGAGAVRAALLFGLLWPVFAWRSLRVAATLPVGHPWNREELRARGLREAAIAALWTLFVAIGLRCF